MVIVVFEIKRWREISEILDRRYCGVEDEKCS